MAESASKQMQQMTMENSSIDERMKLMTRNLQEVIGEERIRDVWQKEQRPPVVYWGTAPTGKIHIAYFVPMAKLADFLKAGCKVKILLADLHAFLDAAKAPMDLLVKRTKYYEVTIKALLKAINVPIDQLEFVTGRSFQLGVPYTTDVYKLMTMMKLKDATRAGSDVVKQDKDHNPVMSCLLYPGLQALDEEHLNVDVQFGGVDQRKIFMLAEEFLPKLDYKKRAHLMNPMVPGLTGGKMSASDEKSKIGLLDTPEEVQKKLKAAFCEEGEVENNGVLAFIKYVLTTAKDLSEIVIHRDEKHGGNMTFSSYEELERAFQRKEVHPLDLKAYVAKEINELLEPIRQEFQKPEMQQLLREAYPSQV